VMMKSKQTDTSNQRLPVLSFRLQTLLPHLLLQRSNSLLSFIASGTTSPRVLTAWLLLEPLPAPEAAVMSTSAAAAVVLVTAPLPKETVTAGEKRIRVPFVRACTLPDFTSSSVAAPGRRRNIFLGKEGGGRGGGVSRGGKRYREGRSAHLQRTQNEEVRSSVDRHLRMTRGYTFANESHVANILIRTKDEGAITKFGTTARTILNCEHEGFLLRKWRLYSTGIKGSTFTASTLEGG
jgi:hypothetical protein